MRRNYIRANKDKDYRVVQVSFDVLVPADGDVRTAKFLDGLDAACESIGCVNLTDSNGMNTEDLTDQYDQYDISRELKQLKSSKNVSRRGSRYVKSATDNKDEYSDIKVYVYDISKFIADDTDGKYIPFHYDGGAAIIVKPNGTGCIVDYEAIGESFDSVNDEVVIELNDVPEKGKFFIMPQYEARVPVKEILDKAPKKTMTVDEFFTKRNYNPRCIQNFNGVKKYLK